MGDSLPTGQEARDVARPPASAPTGGAERPTIRSEGLADAPADRAQPPPRRWWRRVPAFVWAVTAAHTGLLLLFTILYPPYISFDEPQHVDMVVSLLHGDGWPAPGHRIVSQGVVTSSQIVMGSPSHIITPFASRPIAPEGNRPSLAELGDDKPASNRMINQIVQHPPLYYAIGAAVMKATPGHDRMSYDRFVWVLRLISVLMIMPLPVLAWAACRQVTENRIAASAAAVVPAAIPGLTRIGASVNNDNLITLLFSILAVQLLGVATGDLRRRTGVWVGVVALLAILTKAFGFIALPVIVVCYLLGWRRRGGRLPWMPAVSALVIAVVGGGWWWVRNVVDFRTVQPSGYGPGVDIYGHAAAASVARHYEHWAGFYFNLVARTFWSGLGVPLPPEIPRVATLLALYISIALVVVGIVTGTRRTGGRWVLLAACLPLVLTLAAETYQSYKTYHSDLVVAGAQGRYLYLGVVWLAPAVALGLCAVLGRLARLAPLLLLLAAGALQYLAVKAILNKYWALPGSGGRLGWLHRAFQAVDRWSPWPSAFTLACIVVAAVGGVAALVFAVWTARSRTELPPPTRDALPA